jgi:hypothetical protein
MSDKPPPFEDYVSVSGDELWAKILSGEIKAHIYSSEGRGNLKPVPISTAEFFVAEEAGRVAFDGEPDPQLKPYQIMVHDRDLRRPSGTRRHIPVPHWVYVVRKDLPAAKLQKRRGAPDLYDWEEIKQFTWKQLDDRGDFDLEKDQVDGWRSASDLYRAVQDHLDEGECPSWTQLKKRVPRFVDEWRARQGR